MLGIQVPIYRQNNLATFERIGFLVRTKNVIIFRSLLPSFCTALIFIFIYFFVLSALSVSFYFRTEAMACGQLRNQCFHHFRLVCFKIDSLYLLTLHDFRCRFACLFLHFIYGFQYGLFYSCNNNISTQQTLRGT